MEARPKISIEELFKNCDSAYVFEQVRRRLDSGENRSLWRRIESEMQGGSVSAADTYLRSAFSELVQQLRDNVSHLRESLEE